MHDPDEQLLSDLRRIVDQAPDAVRFAARRTVPPAPCLFTAGLPSGADVRCLLDAGTPHHIHRGPHGLRWNDDGRLLHDPDCLAGRGRDFPACLAQLSDLHTTGGVGMYDPESTLRGFRRFQAQWRAYAALPTLPRRLRRTSLLVGFVFGLAVMVTVVAACMLALLVFMWVCVAYFAEWLTT